MVHRLSNAGEKIGTLEFGVSLGRMLKSGRRLASVYRVITTTAVCTVRALKRSRSILRTFRRRCKRFRTSTTILSGGRFERSSVVFYIQRFSRKITARVLYRHDLCPRVTNYEAANRTGRKLDDVVFFLKFIFVARNAVAARQSAGTHYEDG